MLLSYFSIISVNLTFTPSLFQWLEQHPGNQWDLCADHVKCLRCLGGMRLEGPKHNCLTFQALLVLDCPLSRLHVLKTNSVVCGWGDWQL